MCVFFFPVDIRFPIEYITGIIITIGIMLGSLNPHMGARTLAAGLLTTLVLPIVVAGALVRPMPCFKI